MNFMKYFKVQIEGFRGETFYVFAISGLPLTPWQVKELLQQEMDKKQIQPVMWQKVVKAWSIDSSRFAREMRVVAKEGPISRIQYLHRAPRF